MVVLFFNRGINFLIGFGLRKENRPLLLVGSINEMKGGPMKTETLKKKKLLFYLFLMFVLIVHVGCATTAPTTQTSIKVFGENEIILQRQIF